MGSANDSVFLVFMGLIFSSLDGLFSEDVLASGLETLLFSDGDEFSDLNDLCELFPPSSMP